MRGLPKRLATSSDVNNCVELVRAGGAAKEDLLEMMEHTRKQDFINCPIQEVSADGDVITIGYCNEANEGDHAEVDGIPVEITGVTHIKGEAKDGGESSFEKTKITLAQAVDADSEIIAIDSPNSIFVEMGTTRADFDRIMEELKNE